MKKGVIDIEFMIATVVFLSIISFVTFVIITGIPVFRNEAVSDDLRARAYEISEMLLFDEGLPAAWHLEPGVDNVTRLGLSGGERYVLMREKTAKLGVFCSTFEGYKKVKELLGQDFRNDIRLAVTDSSGSVLCEPPVSTASRSRFQITRFATLTDKTVVKIVVSVE